MSQKLIFTRTPGTELLSFWTAAGKPSLFFITDTNTCQLVETLTRQAPELASCPVITIPAGDKNKNLQSLSHISLESVE